MFDLKILFRHFLGDEHGQDVVEYALMLGFVAAAAGALLGGPAVMTSVRIVCAVLAVILLVCIVLRRRRWKPE